MLDGHLRGAAPDYFFKTAAKAAFSDMEYKK
jgi:hypothetical protein